jgi:hypothetical protein
MTRRLVFLVPLAAAVVVGVLGVAAPASGRTIPGSPPFRVLIMDHLSTAQLRRMAKHGAVGLMVPGTGPTTNRRQALAQLVRGAPMNARLGGVPTGRALISTHTATGTPSGPRVIVIELPPKGALVSNDRRYPVVVLGGGYHGLLVSKTTRIPGLVSIVDIAPTALGRERGALGSTPSPHPLASLSSLNRQIHANNRLKLPALILVACIAALLAVVRPRAATTAIVAALLSSVVLGAAQVSNEVVIMAVLTIGTLAGGAALAQLCRDDGRLLALIVGTLVLHLWLLAAHTDWLALTPLGPTQNSRYWGIGNQLETLLLAPLLVGAAIAARRYGRFGLLLFALLGIVLVTDNRFGSDGGGAIVLGVAFAFLATRTLRLGRLGFVTALLTAATVVLGLVSVDLRTPGPYHLRSAFADGFSGLVAVATNRVPLAYAPAWHHWPLVLPLALWFAAALGVALRAARGRQTRDLVLTLGLAVGTSLLVNDSATYELSGGVAALAALVRFAPEPAPLRVRLPVAVPAPPVVTEPAEP